LEAVEEHRLSLLELPQGFRLLNPFLLGILQDFQHHLLVKLEVKTQVTMDHPFLGQLFQVVDLLLLEEILLHSFLVEDLLVQLVPVLELLFLVVKELPFQVKGLFPCWLEMVAICQKLMFGILRLLHPVLVGLPAHLVPLLERLVLLEHLSLLLFEEELLVMQIFGDFLEKLLFGVHLNLNRLRFRAVPPHS
jgi:hypothetical protein